MSQFCIYIKLKPYLKEWLVHSLGEPVSFPCHSNENAVIRTFLQRRPASIPVEIKTAGEFTAICIPDSKAKPAEYYNYISNSGTKAIIEAIEDRFIQNLWGELSMLTLSNNGQGINKFLHGYPSSPVHYNKGYK